MPMRFARLSSKRPGEGIVTFEHTALNQDGKTVAVAVRAALVRVQPAE